MTRDEFLAAVRAKRIDPLAFSLGQGADERYVLDRRGTEWGVYYSERGLESGLRHFPTEAAALDYLLSVLRPGF